ncbi:response regulator [Reichenbachiella sp. MALMAid0571]|uniref:LytR/AlgR family response regulator transcription factor n=1 Tax=Reichenbachiella sp. MALMAid0571 TaxID=3143939 RepID=UPI0032E04434
MSKIRILVVEDDPLHMEKLEMAIEQLDYHMISVADNAEEAMRVIRATKPDLILVDINLNGETDGITLVEKLKDVKLMPVIFTTSYADKETIDRAKVTNPYAYLIKPLELKSLQAAIELAIYNFSNDKVQQSPADDMDFAWEDDVLFKDSFFIKVADRIEKVKYDEVLWIELAEEKYINIVTNDKKLRMRCSLRQLKDKISSNVLVRVNRTHIANAAKIDSINEGKQTIIVGGTEIPLGRTYKQQLLNKLNLLN